MCWTQNLIKNPKIDAIYLCKKEDYFRKWLLISFRVGLPMYCDVCSAYVCFSYGLVVLLAESM